MSNAPDPERWFEENVLPHEAALRAWLHGRFPSLSDADDIVQEAFARVLRAHAAGAIASPKAFLFTTARNLAIDSFRRRNGTVLEPLADLASESVLESGPSSVSICR